MKGSTKVLRVLNQALTEELSSINQYMVQAEMCDDWGYDRLHGSLEKQAMDEMHHAEWLIQRIIFLDGAPNVFKLNPFKIGNDVKAMLAENHKHELEAVALYNKAIATAVAEGDNGTRDLLTKILHDEEDHVDWGESQLEQIKQIGIQNYLARQSGGAEEDA